MEIVARMMTATMDFTATHVFLTAHPQDVLILSLTAAAISFAPISMKIHLLQHRRLRTLFAFNYTGKRDMIGKKRVSNASFV
jgi:hypothetical protein